MASEDPSPDGRVAGLFGRIAKWYDLLNHTLSFGMDILWRRRMVRMFAVAPGDRILDLAAGTLDVSLEFVRRHPGALVAAADFCLPMLQQGKQKLGRHSGSILPVCADGRALPFADEQFTGVSIAFGIRNITPRAQAYAEILRVLKPGGMLCILEFGSGRNVIWHGLYNVYLRFLLPLIGRFVSRDREAYAYLAETIRSFPTARELAAELIAAGFEQVGYVPLTSGIVNLHVGRKPERGVVAGKDTPGTSKRKSGARRTASSVPRR